LAALRAAGERRLTRTEIREHFGRHKPADEINRALGVLIEYGSVRPAKEESGGRPTERFFALS